MPILLAHIKAGNTYKDSLNEIKKNCLFIALGKKNLKGSIQYLAETNIRMTTIFMNSENSKTSDVHRLRFNLTSKMDLRRGGKGVALSELSVYYTWKNIKMSYKNNKSKISGEIWDEEFELPDGYYSVSDIQEHFEHIIKKHETLNDKPPVQIFANKIQNRATMKIKSW